MNIRTFEMFQYLSFKMKIDIDMILLEKLSVNPMHVRFQVLLYQIFNRLHFMNDPKTKDAKNDYSKLYDGFTPLFLSIDMTNSLKYPISPINTSHMSKFLSIQFLLCSYLFLSKLFGLAHLTYMSFIMHQKGEEIEEDIYHHQQL